MEVKRWLSGLKEKEEEEREGERGVEEVCMVEVGRLRSCLMVEGEGTEEEILRDLSFGKRGSLVLMVVVSRERIDRGEEGSMPRKAWRCEIVELLRGDR